MQCLSPLSKSSWNLTAAAAAVLMEFDCCSCCCCCLPSFLSYLALPPQRGRNGDGRKRPAEELKRQIYNLFFFFLVNFEVSFPFRVCVCFFFLLCFLLALPKRMSFAALVKQVVLAENRKTENEHFILKLTVSCYALSTPILFRAAVENS